MNIKSLNILFFNYKIDRACLIIVGFFFISHNFYSQNQKFADSLINVYDSNVEEDELEILKSISENETSPEVQLYYADILIKKALKDSLFNFLYSGFLQKGYAYHDMGKYSLSLESFLKSREYAFILNDKIGIAALNISIADVYSEMGNSENAELYYNKAINVLRKENDSISLATALLNAGDEAFNNDSFEKALNYFDESGLIFQNLNHPLGIAYNLGNTGMVYAELGRSSLAEKKINKAISLLEEFEDFTAIAEYLTYMSDVYKKNADFGLALYYAHKSLKIAIKNDLQKQIRDSNLKLSELHKAKKNNDSALYYFERYIVYRDSIRNLDKIEEIADLRYDSEMSIKQRELQLAAQKSRTQLIILGFTGVILITLIFFFTSLRKEKQKSEKLLLNILPEETAEELKKVGKVTAKKYESVSVLFTDFKGFTSYSEKLSPEELVKTVGFYFSKFDAIIEKYNLEKIKTIGDAYMCAGGIYHNKDDHAQKIVAAALEIAAFVDETKKDAASGELNFDIRIGINTGPVVAGVVGTKKFAYDIWGDTVNLASRMESNGEIGKVNVSEATYRIVKDHYNFEYRGEIAVKNKDPQKMYLVKAA